MNHARYLVVRTNFQKLKERIDAECSFFKFCEIILPRDSLTLRVWAFAVSIDDVYNNNLYNENNNNNVTKNKPKYALNVNTTNHMRLLFVSKVSTFFFFFLAFFISILLLLVLCGRSIVMATLESGFIFQTMITNSNLFVNFKQKSNTMPANVIKLDS